MQAFVSWVELNIAAAKCGARQRSSGLCITPLALGWLHLSGRQAGKSPRSAVFHQESDDGHKHELDYLDVDYRCAGRRVCRDRQDGQNKVTD
jgi:hypothetical protein